MQLSLITSVGHMHQLQWGWYKVTASIVSRLITSVYEPRSSAYTQTVSLGEPQPRHQDVPIKMFLGHVQGGCLPTDIT